MKLKLRHKFEAKDVKHDFQLEAEGASNQKEGKKTPSSSWVTVALIISLTIAVAISLYFVVRITITYNWTNQPQMEQNIKNEH